MSVKKWIPWNWFKKEEEDVGSKVPVQRANSHDPAALISGSLAQFHQEFDRLFEQAFRGLDLLLPHTSRSLWPRMTDGMIKPTLDLGATDKEYAIAVEVPGVDEKDVKVEIAGDTLTIRGEKKQEATENDKNYYRMERRYGSFQRILSLPEDADQEGVSATFKNGILTITMPRKAAPRTHVRQIQIHSA